MLLDWFLAFFKVDWTSVKIIEMKGHEQVKCIDYFKQVLHFHSSFRLYRLNGHLLVCLGLTFFNNAGLLCFHVQTNDNG